jgi:protein-disulfide isomerase
LNATSPIEQKIAGPILGLAFACAAVFGASALAQTRPKTSVVPAAPVSVPNWALGQANARVTLLEYGSLTCGGCATFANSILPNIKRNYIDTGRIRYVFRASPTPPVDLSFAMHALTICAGPTRYYPLTEAFFDRQGDIFAAAGGETGPKGTIFAIAEDFGGLSFAASEACLREPTALAKVRASANMATAAGVASTPSFFINNVAVTAPPGQFVSEERLIAALDAALRATQQSRPASAPAKKAKKQ